MDAGVAYRLRKFVRRNQGAVLAAALVLLALLAGIIGTTWGLLESVEQRDQAKLEKLEAVKQSGLAEAARNDADRHRQQAEEAGRRRPGSWPGPRAMSIICNFVRPGSIFRRGTWYAAAALSMNAARNFAARSTVTSRGD